MPTPVPAARGTQADLPLPLLLKAALPAAQALPQVRFQVLGAALSRLPCAHNPPLPRQSNAARASVSVSPKHRAQGHGES